MVGESKMKKYILNGFVVAALLFAASCKPEIESPASTTAGQANFSKYIAVGNSLTSGYADGGLYLEGQKVAYPNLIAEKMATVGGGSFTSPFFTDAQANGSGYLSLTALVNGTPTIAPVAGNAFRPGSTTFLTKYTGEVQNLGIPGMRVDLAFAAPYGAANQYMERLLTDAQVGTVSYFQFIQGRNHTFFSLWLGNNDALGYATNGGVTTDATNVLTDKSTFSLLYSNLVNTLTAGGQKGIVATIPDVTAIPYFNTVTASALLAAAKASNPAAAAAIFIQTGTGAVRIATNEDLIRLPFQSAGLFGVPNASGIPYGLHPLNPIANNWVLDKDEVLKVKDYVNSYNSSIKSLANGKGLAIADVYNYLNQVKTGIMVNGVGINSSFITGGAFSLDGVHLTPRGNALIANLFVDAINTKYGSTIPVVDVSQYRGIKFPN